MEPIDPLKSLKKISLSSKRCMASFLMRVLGTRCVGSLALVVGIFSVVHSPSCAAADRKPQGPLQIKVRLESKPAPAKAVGILLSTDGLQQIEETTITKVDDKLFDVCFNVDRKLLTDDTVATAMSTNADGTVSFANVTPALAQDSNSPGGSIPECPGEDPSGIAASSQLGSLEKLLGIREQRAKFARLKISRLLDESTLQKLSRFEEIFGLNTSLEPISADLPASELIDRISRLNFAVQEFKAFKQTSGPQAK